MTDIDALLRELESAWSKDRHLGYHEAWLAVARLVLDREAALKARLEMVVREVEDFATTEHLDIHAHHRIRAIADRASEARKEEG